MALAWRAGRKHSGYGDPIVVPRGPLPGRYEKHFHTPHYEDTMTSPQYEVEVKTQGNDGYDLMV